MSYDAAYEDYEYDLPIEKGLHPIYDPEKVYTYLYQTKVWKNGAREDIRIKGMSKEYLFNVLKWGHNNFDKILFTLNMSKEINKGPDEHTAWSITDLPLFGRIHRRYIKLAQNGV